MSYINEYVMQVMVERTLASRKGIKASGRAKHTEKRGVHADYVASLQKREAGGKRRQVREGSEWAKQKATIDKMHGSSLQIDVEVTVQPTQATTASHTAKHTAKWCSLDCETCKCLQVQLDERQAKRERETANDWQNAASRILDGLAKAKRWQKR